MDTATRTCHDCGGPAETRVGRNLCRRCYSRHYAHGTLDLFPPLRPAIRPGASLPADRAAFDAYCDAAYAAFLADVHRRERARRSLVLADPADLPPGELRRYLAAAPVAAG